MVTVCGALLLLLLCLLPVSSAYAQNERTLVLREGLASISLVPYMGHIEKARSSMTPREVTELYDQGQVRYLSEDTQKIGFGLDGTPSWFVLNIKNLTDQEDFVFSLTRGLYNTQGIIEHAILYGGSAQGEISIKLNSPYLRFNVAQQSDAMLLLYINPADYMPLVLTPQISTETGFFILQDAEKDGALGLVFLFLGAGFALFLSYALRNVRYIPYFLSFCSFAALLVSAKLPVLEEGFGEAFHSVLIFLTMTFMALGTLLHNTISWKDKNELLSVGIPFILMVLAGLTIIFTPDGFGIMNLILIFIPGMLFCLSFIVLCLAFYQDGYKASLWLFFAWLCTGLSLLAFLSGGFNIYNDLYFIPSSLPYGLLGLSQIFTFTGIVLTQKDQSQDKGFDFSILPTSIKDLKEAEEEGEYNRLLTVVERERQMMSELRQIDVRRRKDMQKAKESADEANRAKSAFLAVVSHEIRTPMTGIMGLIRLLMDTPLSNEQQKYAKSIMESGESMTLLLNDILDFEKIESGKMSLEQVYYDVKGVAQSAATLMAGHAQTKNIFLSVEVDEGLPLEIRGDPARLRQVLLNLIGNAIKFTEKGGVNIHLTKGTKTVQEDNTQNLFPFSISIEDSGIGIPADATRDLFNPFSQADKSISGKYGGSGLGLAICQRLVELMGGEITVESTEGVGSRFTIHLIVEVNDGETNQTSYEKIDYTSVKSSELARQNDILSAAGDSSEAPVPDALEEEKEIENPEALSLLVVEDNLVSQQVIESFLKKQGHKVTACSNAEDALTICQEEKFDMVFMDWELPGMSGPEAIRKIKDDPKLHIEHTLLLTGHRVTREETGLNVDQLSGILNKPVMPEHLERAIQKYIYKQDISEEHVQEPPVAFAPEDKKLQSNKEPPAREDKEQEEKIISASDKAERRNEKPALMRHIESLENGDEKAGHGQEVPDVDGIEAGHEGSKKRVSEDPGLWENDIFDQQLISSLLHTLGEAKVKELMKNVFEKTDEILVDLQAAMQARDINEIDKRAHELKGMAGNFALLEIHELARRLEENVKMEAGSDVKNLLFQIQEAHLKAKNIANL